MSYLNFNNANNAMRNAKLLLTHVQIADVVCKGQGFSYYVD